MANNFGLTLLRVLLLIIATFVAKEGTANTYIRLCNKGTVPVYVTYLHITSMWAVMRPWEIHGWQVFKGNGDCETLDTDFENGLYHLVFGLKRPDGVFGVIQYNLDTTVGLFNRIDSLCVSNENINDKGVDGSGKKYAPPCKNGFKEAAVSGSFFINDKTGLTFTVQPTEADYKDIGVVLSGGDGLSESVSSPTPRPASSPPSQGEPGFLGSLAKAYSDTKAREENFFISCVKAYPNAIEDERHRYCSCMAKVVLGAIDAETSPLLESWTPENLDRLRDSSYYTINSRNCSRKPRSVAGLTEGLNDLIGLQYEEARSHLSQKGWRLAPPLEYLEDVDLQDPRERFRDRYPEQRACAVDGPWCSFSFFTSKGDCLRVITEGTTVESLKVMSFDHDCE